MSKTERERAKLMTRNSVRHMHLLSIIRIQHHATRVTFTRQCVISLDGLLYTLCGKLSAGCTLLLHSNTHKVTARPWQLRHSQHKTHTTVGYVTQQAMPKLMLLLLVVLQHGLNLLHCSCCESCCYNTCSLTPPTILIIRTKNCNNELMA